MAIDSGVWYVVVRRADCSYTFMPEASFKGDNGSAIVEYLSPMPFYASV